MGRHTGRNTIAISLLVLAVVGCGGGDGPEVSDARLGQPTGPNAAVYFTVSSGTADRLVGVSTGVAGSVEIHETVMGDEGTMGMSRVDGLDIPAEGTLVLEPGGLHLMLLDADRLDVGETIELTLTWETAGEQTIEVEVVDPADTMGDG